MTMPQDPQTPRDYPKFSEIFAAASGLVRVILLGVVIIFALFHWTFFSTWLDTLQHGEVLGFKFDRKINDATSELINNKQSKGDADFLENVINAADLLSPALQGAKILWIDSNVGHNSVERRLLEALGIHVQVAWSWEAARDYLDGTQETPDLVISNVGGS